GERAPGRGKAVGGGAAIRRRGLRNRGHRPRIAGQGGFCFNDGRRVKDFPRLRTCRMACSTWRKKCVETSLDWLLATFLRRYIRQGSLQVTTASGRTRTFGDGSGPPVAVRFTTAKAQREVLFNPQLRLGEAYMDGTFVFDQGSIPALMAIPPR